MNQRPNLKPETLKLLKRTPTAHRLSPVSTDGRDYMKGKVPLHQRTQSAELTQSTQ